MCASPPKSKIAPGVLVLFSPNAANQMSNPLILCLFLSLIALCAAAPLVSEVLRIERSRVDGSFQKVHSGSQTYAEYSIQFEIPLSLPEEAQVRHRLSLIIFAVPDEFYWSP